MESATLFLGSTEIVGQEISNGTKNHFIAILENGISLKVHFIRFSRSKAIEKCKHIIC